VNVLRSSTLVISLLLLSGCAFPGLGLFSKTDVKPVEIVSKPIERSRLDLPDPKPLKGREFEWFIITPENADEVFNKLKEKNVDLVLIGLTDVGYEELAMTMAEVRNLIAQQRTIIIKYKEYYEPTREESKPADSK
jgi:hypothetical protein